MEDMVLTKMIEYFAADVKRINHAIKVFTFTKIIAAEENLTDFQKLCLSYSSILHDIGIKNAELKYNSAAGNYQETEGPPVAENILTSLNIEQNIIKRTTFIIGNHHTYKNIDGIDFQILVEADFIVNIYEDQMQREAVESIQKKIFKTRKGMQLLTNMYLN